MSSANVHFTELLRNISPAMAATATTAPIDASTEVAFSPDGEAEQTVLKVISSAQRSIRLAAYSFTSPVVVRGLLEARKRGVDVGVVVDERGNRSPSSIAALNLLVNAGIPTRTNARYAILHDKYVIVDGRHLQTGSFNFSKAAASRNSENVIVVWNNPKVASQYLDHWQRRWQQGAAYQSSY